MKKIYFLVLAFCVFNGLSAQIVTIPDANFKYLLVNSVCADFNNDGILDGDVDVNNDGEIQESETLNVLQLSIDCGEYIGINFYDKRIISDLTGINSFSNLKKVKWKAVEFNNIEVNLSQLSHLEYILIQWANSSLITSINLSNLSKLIALDLIGIRPVNYDVSNNNLNVNLNGTVNLTDLNYTNSFLNIDFCQIPNLKNLNCFYLEGGEPDVFDFSCLTKLETLDINENWIKTIILKNGSLLKSINWQQTYYYYPEYICLDENSEELDQILQLKVAGPQTVINTYCSFTPGGTFYTIQGNNKLDSNNNGCDALDVNYSNLKFTISDGTTTGSFISNSTGKYAIPVPAGIYTITPVVENPNYFNVSPTTATVTFPTQSSPFIQDYCITENGVHPDLEITLLPLRPAVPGFDTKYKLVYKNKGNITQSGTVNLTFDDAVLDFVVANPVTTTQTTNTLSWDFTNLLPFETREIFVTLNLNSPMETPAVNSGFVLAYKATITSAVIDEIPTDNTFDFNQTVVNSFDPNDKTCLEGTTISPSLIGQYVHYMIRFENMGTFPAENIVVKDMIDLSKFDISTLVPTSASHLYSTKISEGNKVEFIFENINLPFDDANNDGYIAFKIKTKPTLVVGNTFTNDASIYFDYNFPIITNKATSTFKTLGIQDFEFSKYFSLYPNPVNEILNIAATKEIEVKSIAVYDILGQIVLALPNAKAVSKIDVSDLKTGNYFINIDTDKGTSNSKFIKN
jgi:hypothetical protein